MENSLNGRGPYGNSLTVADLYPHSTKKRERFTERFWSRVEILGEDDCWEWRGSKLPKGYGHVQATLEPGVYVHLYTHRVAYVLDGNVLLPGDCVLHSCDNPPCCNPRHLSSGTQVENVQDRDERGRHRAASGENNYLSKLTVSSVRAARDEYAQGGISMHKLAAKHGVDYSTMRSALLRLTWKAVS